MTRTEIIAQLDVEINLLLRARDILAAPLSNFKSVSTQKVKTKISGKSRKQPAKAATPATTAPQTQAVVAPAPASPPQPAPEPQVRVVPPRRRIERRHLQTDKIGKSPAALSSFVPVGPVVVSADEARKVQERNAAPAPTPIADEIRAEIGSERSLGSLIQAFERRAGLNGMETPRS
jgi:hypothetical protein